MVHDPQVFEALDALCPMHAVLNRTGHVIHAGPTLAKLPAAEGWQGKRFLELVHLQRPRHAASLPELLKLKGRKLHLELRTPCRTRLKGVIMPWGDGALVNLSFGISIVEVVQEFSLTSADFAPTDLTVEMLYLVEAKSAAMEESRRLNARLQGAKIAAEEQAFTDTLTGLKNRRAMDHVLGRLAETGEPFALMHLDLDFFKTVNDTLGHAAGDHVLQSVSRALVDLTRRGDTVARIGGDEFVVIMRDTFDKDQLSEAAGRIISRLEQPILFQDTPCKISASIGTTISTYYARPDPVRMLADADEALYASKHAGRGRHCFYEPRAAQGNSNHA